MGQAAQNEVSYATEATCQKRLEALVTASLHARHSLVSPRIRNAQLKPYIQYTSLEANAILETSGRGSFIAPAVGFLHYGPSCYLYDHVCNFNYQGEHLVCPAHSYHSQCHWS